MHLACQAEYGTGVRAGSLDQATEQKGVASQGALISSNPRDNFRTLGVFPVPTDFIEPSTGGGAVGVRLERFERLGALVGVLEGGKRAIARLAE